MIQELLYLLPKETGSFGLTIAIVGSLIGVIIWLLGARFSRPIITLLTVLLGATIGMHLPQWFGWNISGAGPAVGGALVLGVTGYVLHGMWVGIGLGTVLSSWAAMGCWIAFRNGTTWSWPDVSADTSVADYSRSLWQGLPPDVAHVLPYACATALVTGLGLAIIWPKLSLIIGWSLAGATLLASMGVAAIDFGGQLEWLANIPSPMWAQATLLGCFVAIGSLIQWKLGPRPAASTGSKSARKKSKKDFDDEDDD